ncbi:DUF4402 domain-containing protein [Gramella jeungdoensis]|uniref:DUF4402 domain-containing protein n=1 Tax=Gramella jeungdoensis TaxID=708091 RepID=A0ABT0Z406_9FLAO|nr:DUF4402 domain-containing protein [Gramella jeungdoensis]MCM8570148.1 DUF4402 domain-containing protein [Gramella jeungdoensis]
MKNFTFLLLAFFTANCFAQSSASGTATVNAEIVSPISITSSGSLNFGKIAQDATAGNVIIDAAGTSRTFDNSNMEISTSTFTVPTFTVTRATGMRYGVTTSGDVLQTAGGDTMTLNNITTSLSSTSGLADSSFTVGGTLQVGANQATGTYTGDVTVTVTYE